MNRFSLEGKTILITGASSGIGRGMAAACAQMGSNLVITGRNRSRLYETASLFADPEKHRIIPADLTIASERDSLVEKLPMLDGFVSNAGIGDRTLCRNITKTDINRVMTVNFIAPVLLTSSILAKKKLNAGASIVYTASVAYKSPSIGNSIYSASKGALVSYAKCLALEVASRKIRVNCICPAMVWTDLIYSGGVAQEQLKQDEQKYPLKRYGQPEDIANLAVYLLSDASTWMTESAIQITGGGAIE